MGKIQAGQEAQNLTNICGEEKAASIGSPVADQTCKIPAHPDIRTRFLKIHKFISLPQHSSLLHKIFS
jgi:hypothetical protein